MLEAHQVRSKTRNAVRQREEEVEQEEIESGELNLVPYLDIVTNLMLFLLSSVAAAVVFGQINTMLPDQAPGGASSAKPPDTKPDEVPLGLIVQVTDRQLSVFSVSGLEGTLKEPKLRIGRSGLDGDPCDGSYMCESGACNSKTKACEINSNPDVPRLPVFDYRALNDTLHTIAKRFDKQFRKPETFRITLQADGNTPYETLVSVIGAMRCKMPPIGEARDRCMLPSGDIPKEAEPVDTEARLFDPARVPYNPDEHALFHDVMFSDGWE
jgi:biopolymer transport protein ExbD